ncbi:MAG: hypothetical protein DRP66_00460 [Planctomycetota bacterium]|nr:MAG: hypothetical protein DRP66_00460 [Planctomycetota bacterium]
MIDSANGSCIEIIRQSDAPRGFHKALTMLEIIIALAIMMVVFAAVLPQFRNIQNSWASRQGAAEALQNGRVLVGHMSRNLSKAAKIKAVSAPTTTEGYIEFEANDAITYRYELSSNKNVWFGPVGSLSELAGPVSRLQFTCYSLDDLDNPTTDVDQIRSVKIQTTVANSTSLGRDQTFTAQIYLEANAGMAAANIVVEGSQLRFDSVNGQKPAVIKIDDAHYLCTYTGDGYDGYAVVLTVDAGAGSITCGTPYEFDSDKGVETALSKIDDTHYLCTYTGYQDDGWAVILTVDTGTWTVTKEGSFEFDNKYAIMTTVARIDDEHHLCSYSDWDNDCQAVVLTVNKATWTITKETPLQYATGADPTLLWVENSSYLCAYKGGGNGEVVILTVDTGDWTISSSAACTFSTSGGNWPTLCRLDDRYYLCAYTSSANTGWVRMLEVNDSMTVVSTRGSGFEFGPGQGKRPALAEIDDESSIVAWDGIGDAGVAAVLSVDTSTGTITINGGRFDYHEKGMAPALTNVQSRIYLGVYESSGDTGWAVLFDTAGQVRP